MTLVQRDPFAREELHRRQFKDGMERKCAWCGQVRPDRVLYVYRVERDDGGQGHYNGLFCSTPCFRAYHEVPNNRQRSKQ